MALLRSLNKGIKSIIIINMATADDALFATDDGCII